MNFGYGCFHNSNIFSNGVEVLKCILIYSDNKWQHLISIRPTPSSHSAFKLLTDRTNIVINARGEVDTIRETLNNIPVCSIQKLTVNCSHQFIQNVIIQILEYIEHLVQYNLYNAIFKSAQGPKIFCESIACVTNTGKLSFLNRFTLMQEINKKKLLSQKHQIYPILLHFLFSKTKRNKNNQTYVCSPDCKLKSTQPRFLYYDTSNFHLIYCKLFSKQFKETNIDNLQYLLG